MGEFNRDGFNRGRGFGGGNRRFEKRSFPAQKHKAICSDCKQECEVPFKPAEGRPVYCNNCFRNHRNN